MYSNALSIYSPQIGPKLHLKAEIFTKIGTDIMQNYVCHVLLYIVMHSCVIQNW